MIDQFRESAKEEYTVTEVCSALDVATSSYYAAKTRPESRRSSEEKELLAKINEVHADRHTRCYGSPRMTEELIDSGLTCSENRCARIMKKYGVNARQKAAFRPRTTIQNPDSKPAPNLLKKASAPTAPGQVYVSDITYVATREGWLYLAVVMDLYTRMIVGWKLADHMQTSLVTGALALGIGKLPPAKNAIFHSDRGCQYTSKTMRRSLSSFNIEASMSAKGNCYDNAKSESFFSTLKREAFPDDCCFDTKSKARQAIFDYLETFYNRRRRHSSLQNISPDEFFQRHFTNTKPALN